MSSSKIVCSKRKRPHFAADPDEPPARKSRVRMRSGDRGPRTRARTRNHALTELPPEVLRMVFERCDSFKEVARLRLVCRQFNAVCCQVMRSAFTRLQEAVEQSTLEVSREMTAMLRQTRQMQRCVTMLPTRYRGQRALLRTSLCLFQLRSLASQLRIVRATTWGYVSAGVCPFFYGDLLDTYHRVLTKINWVGPRNNARMPAVKSTFGYCRTMTQRFLKHFHYTVDSKLLRPKRVTEVDRRNRVMVPGLTILELMESCLDKETIMTRVLYLKQPLHLLDDFKGDSNPCRLQVSYNLAGCWLGVLSPTNLERRLEGQGSLFQISGILREIIWTSNHDYLISDRRWRDQIIQGDRIYTAGGYTTGRTSFNVVNRNDQVFYFGHQARGQGDNTWMTPQLRINIDVTCDSNTLPENLLQECLALPARSSHQPDAGSYRMKVHMESMEFLW